MRKISLLTVFLLWCTGSTSGSANQDNFHVNALTDSQLLESYWACSAAAEHPNLANVRPAFAWCAAISSAVRVRFFKDNFGPYMEWVSRNKSTSIKSHPAPNELRH